MDSFTALFDALAAMPSGPGLANLYAGDHPQADTRRQNLRRYLAQMQRLAPDVLMLLEAPGYQGCALTGIPVTSERIMLAGVEPFGLFGAGYAAISGRPGGKAEPSATILWGALAQYAPHPPLLWNTCPLHPHQAGDAASNRAPTLAEQRLGYPLITQIMALFSIKRALGVGRVAQAALMQLDVPFTPLRHPSQGGKPAFIAGLQAYYSG